jgi:hypothetical protein
MGRPSMSIFVFINFVVSKIIYIYIYICMVKVKMYLYVTNLALRHEGVWGSGYIDPHFLDFGTSWR